MSDITQTTFQGSLADLIGIPHADLDCWGLVVEFYRRHGRKLPSYLNARRKDSKTIAATVDQARKEYIEVPYSDRKYGDILLINFLGVPSHIAVVISKNEMLHSREKYSSCIEKIKRWETRIVKVYRVSHG